MLKTLNDDGTDHGGSPAPMAAPATPAGLAIDASRLLPFLAPAGLPAGAPSIEAVAAAAAPAPAEAAPPEAPPARSAATLRDFNPPPAAWLGGSSTSTDAPRTESTGTGPSADLRSTRIPIPPDSTGTLAESLAPFGTDALPASRGVSGLDRVLATAPPPARGDTGWTADSGGFSIGSPAVATSAAAPEGIGRFGTDSRAGPPDPSSWPWGRTSAAGFETSAASSGGPAAGDPSGLEARLARAVDRLERLAELLDQAGPASRGGPSRPFRGRVDA